jgi:site-specific recombinase XerD
VDEWLKLMRKRNKNEITVQEFKERLENYPVRLWGEKPIGELTEADLIDFIEWRKAEGRRSVNPATSTIKRDIVPLRQVLEYAYGKKYLSHKLQLPKITVSSNRRPDFSEKEWKKVVRKLPEWVKKAEGHHRHYRDRLYLMYYVLVLGYSGIRPGTEAHSITWKSLRKEHEYPYPDKQFRIHVARGKKGPRVVTPEKRVETDLQNLRKFRISELRKRKQKFDLNEPVFCHENGTPIKSFKKGFDQFLSNYNLLHNDSEQKRSPYSLRHTYATRKIVNGAPHWELAKNMGTSVEQLEKFYVHDNPALWGRIMAQHPIPHRVKSDILSNREKK